MEEFNQTTARAAPPSRFSSAPWLVAGRNCKCEVVSCYDRRLVSKDSLQYPTEINYKMQLAGFVKLLRANFRLGLLLLITAMLPLISSSFMLVWIYHNRWVFELPTVLAISVFTALSALLIPLALMPSIVAAMLAGYFFGVLGLISIFVSYPVALVIGLLLGRFLVGLVGARPFTEIAQYQKYLTALSRQELLLIICLRLSPTFPFAMINVLLATLPTSWSKYVLGSMLGMLPRTLVFFFAGMAAIDIWNFIRHPSLDGALSLLPVLLVIASLVGLVVVLQRVLKEINFSATSE